LPIPPKGTFFKREGRPEMTRKSPYKKSLAVNFIASSFEQFLDWFNVKFEGDE